MAEKTMVWFTWYWGWIGVIAAIVGLVIVLWRRSVNWTAEGLAIGVSWLMMAAYLVRPAVTPDHIWAMRRFLTPGTLIMVTGVAVLLEVMSRELEQRGSVSVVARRGMSIVLAGAIIAFPFMVSLPMLGFSRQAGMLSETEALCNALPPDAAVLVEPGRLGTNYAITVRTFCDVPTVTLRDPSDAAHLSMIVDVLRGRGRVPVFLSVDGGYGEPIAGGRSAHPIAQTPIDRPPSIVLEIEHVWELELLAGG